MAKLHEAQANMAYYGFRRAPEEDFSDDGTRFFMWVWDPENTGKSPFYFSKAGGYGSVYFSDHTWYNRQLNDEIKKRGYHLDDLNGVDKEYFTDEALGKIVAQLQEIRESSWFEDICPEFSTRGAIDKGFEVKDYNADKDHQRVMDIAKRANSDPEKMAKLAANMAKAIGDKEKMRSRWQAAIDIYGSDSPVAKAFEAQVNDRGWYINIKPRSGDIDWSSLFESVKDESIYKAHAEYEKDQLKKKEDEDNQENFTFDEGSVKLATVVKESIEDGKIETDTFVVTDFSDDSYKNPKVKRIKIADGVTSIKEDAFFNCKNLTEVIIPDSVTSIENDAFENCKNLKTIHYAGTRDQWNAIEKAFDWKAGCPQEVIIDYRHQENSVFDKDAVKLTTVKESEERKYWNNFFDKLTESTSNDKIEDLLKDHFETDDVSLSDETCYGLPVYIIDGKRYAVGDSDEAYDAAVQQAIGVFEDDTEEGQIRWLQKNNWPGIDEESVCEDLGDDPDDYEEGDTIYKPSSIDDYIDTMGFIDAADAFSMAFIGNYLNKRELGEYVVDYDGVGPLASEDGREIYIGNDLSAFCLGEAY